MEFVEKFKATRIDERSSDIIGNLRINPKCYTDAFIPDPKGGFDIYIEGASSRNVALDGDTVRVEINPIIEWKLNLNTIATRWDDWSNYLLPIIDTIEKEGINKAETEQNDRVGLYNASLGSKNEEDADKRVGKIRCKRQVKAQKNNDGLNNDGHVVNDVRNAQHALPIHSKMPSNLPIGISKLKVEHVSKLPFASQCIQKTGKVVEIIKRNHNGLAGGYLKKYSTTHALFSPIDSRIPRMLIDIRECPLDFATSAIRYKDILFIAQLIEWLGNKSFASGSLVKIIGDSNEVASRIEILLIEHQIYDTDFSTDAYKELEYLNHLPDNWIAENSKGRRDLTDECIFTIDPKTARDLDDAVSIRQVAEQIYEVGVHIADVSFFVEEMTAIDYYARLRTTSVYLVDRVIPMLPRPLCEHMCSLNPNEPKLTFSVIWKMDKYGRIIDEWFGRTVIKSCVKLAYENAQDIINKPNDLSWIQEDVNMPKLYAFDWNHIAKSIVQLNKISKNMRAKRFQNGALRIEQVKLKYELDKSTGMPIGFTFEHRTDSNFLIEEFMLQANMSVAKKIFKYSNESAFLRRHQESCPRVLQEVKEFCDAKGYPLDISSAGAIQKSLNAIDDKTTSKVVSFLLLRAMKNAEYICAGSLAGDNNYRHFALNVPLYTHFTSPIRRYADVIVHRQLSLALDYESKTNEDVQTLKMMADECTKRKISSKLISEASQKLYFNLFVRKAGYCELLACVTKIMNQSFEVILIDYDQVGRVYLEQLKSQLSSYRFESFSGVKRLVLDWKLKRAIKKNRAKSGSKSKQMDDEEKLSCRSTMETRKCLSNEKNLRVNETYNKEQQIIEVFDIIRVNVTVDEKDISKLIIDLKTPGT